MYENRNPPDSVKLNLSVSAIFMLMYIIYRLLLLSLLWVAFLWPASGQRNPSQPFPYALGWKKDGPLAGGALVMAALGYGLPRSKPVYTPQDFSRLNPSSVNGLDRGATRYYSPADDRLRTYILAGTGVTGAALLPAIIYKTGDNLFWSHCIIVGTMYAEGLVLNLGAGEWCKKFVDRDRPYAYNMTLTYAQKSSQDYGSSFYSMTTALQWYTAGFIATVVNDLCPGSSWKYLVWGGAAAFSLAEGYLSVRSGQHFPTDVVVGALVGGFTGVLMPALHRKKGAKDRSFSVFPGLGFAGTPQLCLVTHF